MEKILLQKVNIKRFVFVIMVCIIISGAFYGDGRIKVRFLVKLSSEFSWIEDFNNGIADAIMRDGRSSYIDRNGNIIFSSEMPVNSKKEEVNYFSPDEDLLGVKEDNKYGFEDKSGNLVVPYIYDDVGYFREDMCAVKKDGMIGYISIGGELVIPLIYRSGYAFTEGFACVQKYFITEHGGLTDKWGYINKNGEIVIPLIYDKVLHFCEGFARVAVDGKWGFIDVGGNNVVPLIYDKADNFYGGLAAVEKDGYWGVIDTKDDVVIPFIYDDIGGFYNETARVEKNEKIGYIDKTGKIIIPIEYAWIGNFNDGLALAIKGRILSRGSQIRFIDEFGIIHITKDHGWYESEGSGYIDKKGRVILPCIYDYASDFNDGLAVVEKDGKWGVLEIIN